MRILIVNTSERTGGAAVAAGRLMDALNACGIEARMLVGKKETHRDCVVGLDGRLARRWHFLWERLCVFLGLRLSRQRLFEIDIANSGSDITRLPEFKRADVIHLNWINQGMLSLNDIRKILDSGKPVAWTMHDLWPAAGICHYARGCEAFKTGCGHCPLLPGGGSEGDLSHRVWKKKRKIYANRNIHFVTCSRWLEGQARQSGLLAGLRVSSIPNTIDTSVFAPGDMAAARRRTGLPEDKRVILFVSHRVTDGRKGMDYFTRALERLVEERPAARKDTVVAILGGESEAVAERLPLEACPLGYVGDDAAIVDIYRSADLYVLPSLEDNLPNTIMEALACGLPCVGFRVGGIPEMIDHSKNGYVAAYKDTDDLARGMAWVLYEADRRALAAECVRKVERCYSQQSVAMRYTEVYNELVAHSNYIKAEPQGRRRQGKPF